MSPITRAPSRISTPISRRRLLKGLGAGAALAPFLSERSLTAAAPAGNLIIFHTPNGHKRRLDSDPTALAFDATTAAGALSFGQSLRPLQPFQSDVAVVRGLNLKTPTFIASHQDICRILTCRANPNGETDRDQFTAFGPSIDQAIGAAVDKPPLVVAVDPYRDTPHWRTALSWSASGVVAPFVKDHAAVLDELFGGAAGSVPSTAHPPIHKATSRADFFKTQIGAARARVAARARAHQPWTSDAVRSLEQSAQVSPAVTCDATALRSRVAALPTPPARQPDDKSYDGAAAEMQARGELWMDIIAQSFACGARRVATIQWQGASEGYDPVANAGSPTHHSVTEYAFGSMSGARWMAIDAWYAQRFAYQLAALDRLGILDRTIVVWVSEITEGHNQTDMVTVVAGGQALGMKTGKYVRYPFIGTEVEGAGAIPLQQNPANRSLADLWVTVQQAMGIPNATFGDPKWCAGPLTELRG
ncbi:MAG TPA: DUF1552 domain-containing protein [Polyangia bacterium]|nr:DUF1552 domain-containing protein [Polyangia bacterium]